MGDRLKKLRQRRLAKKKPDLPGLAPVERKQPNGRKKRTPEDRDKATENLKARCRQMGREATPENIREMRAAWWGCSAGRAIGMETLSASERSDLWGAICHMRRVTAAYDAALGAPKRHAACLRLLTPVDEMSADASSAPLDTRTDEEKQRQAVSAWMRMHGWLGNTDRRAEAEALRVVLDDVGVVDAEGLIAALRCVSEGIKGQKIRCRVRA